MLPTLTPLQYLVLNLLFAGSQSGKRLRGQLESLGVRQSRSAFSRMMMRLATSGYVRMRVRVRRAGRQTERRCLYKITDLAVAEWTRARKFYLNLAPPSDDLLPASTARGRMAAYDPKLRNNILDKRFSERLARSLDAIVRGSIASANRDQS